MTTTFARYSLLVGLALALILPGAASLLAQQDNGTVNDNENGGAATNEEAQPPTEEDEEQDPDPADTEPEEGEEEGDDVPEEAEEEVETFTLPALSYPEHFVVAREFTSSLELAISVDGYEFDRLEREQTTSTRTRIEGVQVDDEGNVHRARFFILGRDVSQRTGDGPQRRTESPLLGNLFIAQWNDEEEAVRVTDGNDEEQTGEAAEVIRGEFDALRAGFPLLDYFSEAPRALGEEVALDPALAAGLFEVAGPFRVEELAVTPREVRTIGEPDEDEAMRHAVIELRVVLAGEIAEEMPATLTLSGEFHVDAESGWPVRLEASGPLEIHAERAHGEQTLALRGTGNAELAVSFE